MRYCVQCLEPTTRPDSEFDENGVCLPCRYVETIDHIDWARRRRELEEVADWARARNVSGYDCIVPVSGGKDSHRQAMYCRDELGLKPLLVSVAYPPEEQTERGAANIANLIELGFDCIYVSPGPETWRRAMATGFRKFGNIYKSTELPLYAATPKVAIAYHIPLVVYGENPAIAWGGSGGSQDGDASREIRLRRMSREQGIELAQAHRDVAPPDRQSFLDWVGLGETEFERETDRFRDPAIWERADGSWRLKDGIENHRDDPGVEVARLAPLESWRDFPLTPSKDPNADETQPVLLAKGYMLDQRVRPAWSTLC